VTIRPSASFEAQSALRTSVARELGVGRGELAGPRWRSPYRGVQVPATPAADTPYQRILDAAQLLPPGAALGGWAAAFLLGAKGIDGRGRSGREAEAVPIVLPPPLAIRPRPGLVLWRSRLADADLRGVEGVPCTAPLRTAFDLARTRSLGEAVVALDAVGRSIGVPPGEVLGYAARHRGWRGVPVARQAVTLADPRAMSTGETRLRLLWVLDAGLPRPLVNPEVFDVTGFLVGMVDLLDEESGLVGEYDGAHHRDPRTHANDNVREEGLEGAGLVVVRAGALDLGPERRRTVARLQAAYRRASGLAPAARQWWCRPRPLPRVA
jgi:hypothetical protein